ncbi:MAG TPA: 4-(cytidine 5'-diphospho)-2-C-methyl-D-erythritol kinase [Solirubrobacteraceae bacterium]|jgi:4-diphosphocytidyl-2-C-methyl-D-erythritol kinase|nr:4-(cytidine 5'-diphospho)-2-C-methyl-D-erythritol kinase [Solirubrobacteraceae bacterium]
MIASDGALVPMALPLRTLAPAKINLGLFVGPTRPDGKHELVSVMQPVSLADEITLEPAADGDEVVCPGVEGENLAARAIELFRQATGWNEGPVRLSIDKRIPVAAGMGGGSADAGAALRLMRAASGLSDMDLLLTLAAELGADVPAQVMPTRTLATGAGELLEPLPDPFSPIGVLVLPQAQGLSTAAVYAQADRTQPARDARYLVDRREGLRAAFALGAAVPEHMLLANDLQDACRSLSLEVAPALAQAQEAGAEHAFVSGSGPTVVGLFARANGAERARRAAAALAGRVPAPIAAETVGARFAAVQPLGA